jgi:hypothetical protein
VLFSGGLLACLLPSCSASPAVIASSAARRGAVACESRLCSEIGIGLLEHGVSGGGRVLPLSGAGLIM